METLLNYQKQEEKFVFSHFYHRDAFVLGSYLSEVAVQNKYPIAIQIEVNGNVVYQYTNDGATTNNYVWIDRKRNVVNRFQMSSGALAAKLSEREMNFDDLYGEDKRYAVTPGAFPIRTQGVGVIGSIGVSGLDSDSDHQLIVEGLNYLLKKQEAEE